MATKFHYPSTLCSVRTVLFPTYLRYFLGTLLVRRYSCHTLKYGLEKAWRINAPARALPGDSTVAKLSEFGLR